MNREELIDEIVLLSGMSREDIEEHTRDMSEADLDEQIQIYRETE